MSVAENNNPNETEDLLGGFDLPPENPGTENTPPPEPQEPSPETSEKSGETPAESPPQSPTTPSVAEEKIVELPELKRLTEDEVGGIHISTLTILPEGWRLTKTLGLVQTAVLLQAKRIQEIRLQKGIKDAMHQLKEEAIAMGGNAIWGIQISVIPLGQLYPDSVWISACGTCCLLEK